MPHASTRPAPVILLATHGSLGDLHPFMALGLALQARGAKVVLASHPDYAAKVEAAGLHFHAFGASRETYQRDLRLKPQEIIHRLTRDHGFMIKRLIVPYLATSVDTLRPLAAKANMVIGSSFAYGAHMAALLESKPFAVVALQPTVMMSVYDPPKVKKAPFIFAPKSATARQYNRLIVWLGERFMASTQAGVRKVYRQFGLKPRISLGGIISDDLTLALYDPVLGAIKPDFPSQTQMCGFGLYDSENGQPSQLLPDLEAFLESGPAPLVFSLGSAVVMGGEQFYRTAIKASKTLSHRAILLVGVDSLLLTEDHGPDIKIVPYAPHSLLFPRARIIVHHGGIGSTAQALRAGRPQLVTPVFADQFDNAQRVERLGCGDTLNYDRWTYDHALSALDYIAHHPEMDYRARAVVRRLLKTDGADAAAVQVLDHLKLKTET